jgi:ubiquinone/menaquinone biosynthesis C-methylase UbiE
MDKSIEKSISDSLETKTAMLPFLPQLLADMWALGSSPEIVVDLLKPLNLPAANTKVLDLGCGKGAVAITLAKEFGYHSVGIDACAEFLQEAQEKAAQFKVAYLCHFDQADIREYVKNDHDFDVVCYISMGNILGNFAECVKKLRNVVRSHGYIIIDDGFLKGSEKISRTGYEYFTTYEQTIKLLTSHGDHIIKELIYTDEKTRSINLEYLQALKNRAPGLIEKHPEVKQLVTQYIRNQETECDVIEKNITGAIWLIKRYN